MSVGAGIHESYWTDPLTLAAKARRRQGHRRRRRGRQHRQERAGPAAVRRHHGAGQRAVGADRRRLEHDGHADAPTTTRWRASARAGPTYIDFGAKPDLVAPGTGTVSLAVPGSTFYMTKALYLLDGHEPGIGSKPYLTLSGTSMAAPVVSGTVALMLQANPNLTPNLVKAILQYTAQAVPGYNPLRQGAGFLNALGAVRLAKFYATDSRAGTRCRCRAIVEPAHHLGQPPLSGGVHQSARQRLVDASSGAPRMTASGDNIVWGTNGDNIVWGTDCGDGATTSCGAPTMPRRQHRLGHARRSTTSSGAPATTTTSCGAPTTTTTSSGARAATTTSSGAPARRRRQHRVGHDCGGADCDNIVWGTARRRQHRVGHGRRRRQHRLGHAAATTTSSGARRPTRRHLGQLRRRPADFSRTKRDEPVPDVSSRVRRRRRDRPADAE